MTVLGRSIAGLLFLVLVGAAPALAGEPPYSEARLWRVRAPGNDAPNHIFGTVHSDREAVVDLSQPVERAFDTAQRYAFELDFDNDIQMAMTRAMMDTQGPPLSERLGDATWRQLQQVARARGLPPQQLDRLAPWAVALTLATPDVQPRQTLDQVLYRRAERSERPITGLETVDEQIAVFAGLSEAQQLDMLRRVIELGAAERIDPLLERLVDAWLAGDLARLVELSEAHPMMGNAKAQEALEQRLVAERNARMAERMAPLLDRGGAFVAIGALHLPGDEGVLQRLAGAGYDIAPVH